jgi:two-component system sensor histidine kinase YesM
MLECSIIPLVFQPIVENSINHGFEDYGRIMDIRIEGSWTEQGEMLFRIMDNGVGMSPDKQSELRALLDGADSHKYKFESIGEQAGKGLGLQNIAERIKLHYGDRYYLTIIPGAVEGTKIEILIPKV